MEGGGYFDAALTNEAEPNKLDQSPHKLDHLMRHPAPPSPPPLTVTSKSERREAARDLYATAQQQMMTATKGTIMAAESSAADLTHRPLDPVGHESLGSSSLRVKIRVKRVCVCVCVCVCVNQGVESHGRRCKRTTG